MVLTGLARLGRDVEVRFAQDGTAVANLALAYNYGKKDADGKRPTTWVEGALWGERAQKLAPYLLKGQQLCVVLDDVAINIYKKADGSTGASIKARVSSIEFAGSKPGEGQAMSAPAAPVEKPAPAAKPAGGKFDDFEDDIPF